MAANRREDASVQSNQPSPLMIVNPRTPLGALKETTGENVARCPRSHDGSVSSMEPLESSSGPAKNWRLEVEPDARAAISWPVREREKT